MTDSLMKGKPNKCDCCGQTIPENIKIMYTHMIKYNDGKIRVDNSMRQTPPERFIDGGQIESSKHLKITFNFDNPSKSKIEVYPKSKMKERKV